MMIEASMNLMSIKSWEIKSKFTVNKTPSISRMSEKGRSILSSQIAKRSKGRGSSGKPKKSKFS